jgi:hypothetical protein
MFKNGKNPCGEFELVNILGMDIAEAQQNTRRKCQ